MDFSEFLRIYSIRNTNINWLFGAGTSVSSGLPSAYDLIWEFKRLIYCTEQRLKLSHFSNLSSVAVRNQIQSYFNSIGTCPEEDSLEEYSFYFEKAYPSAKDRANFLMTQLQGMQNSFGHKVLGIMMKNNLVKIIFTTNFDKAFENAAIAELATLDRFLVASLENTHSSIQKFQEGFRPLIVKLHGDYFSENLKNTSAELQKQDKELREILLQTCISQGLAVMGYSGRDESIMEVLREALNNPTSFPQGIFWFVRPGASPIPAVKQFLGEAREKGKQAEVIEIETFDTAWADIIKVFSDIPADDMAKLNENYFRRKSAQVMHKGSRYPVARFNAVILTEFPLNARVVKCEAGDTKEIEGLIAEKKSDILALRRRDGVVGFGADSDFDEVLSSYGKMEKDIYPIPEYIIGHDDSTIKGLITKALLKALTKDTILIWVKRRDRYLLLPSSKFIEDPALKSLKQVIGSAICGTIPKTKIPWTVALEVSLHRKFDKSFVVLSPTILAGRNPSELDRPHIAPYIKEFMATWYNKKYPLILDEWLNILFKDKKELDVTSFNDSIRGFNPRFKLLRTSAFSKSV